MIDRTTFDKILSDKIPSWITCGHCECEVELNDIDFNKIYQDLVKAELDEFKKSLNFAQTFKPVKPCPHIGSRQVIMANGEDVGEVWCNLENQPCIEDWDKCPKRIER